MIEPISGRILNVYTTEPSIQFYTGNWLQDIKGKNDIIYKPQVGFCLEAQHYPDSPHHPSFPTTVLKPGQVYTQTTVYQFGLASIDK